jgi:hypothetical protein
VEHTDALCRLREPGIKLRRFQRACPPSERHQPPQAWGATSRFVAEERCGRGALLRNLTGSVLLSPRCLLVLGEGIHRRDAAWLA